jgi:hypothetical protein
VPETRKIPGNPRQRRIFPMRAAPRPLARGHSFVIAAHRFESSFAPFWCASRYHGENFMDSPALTRSDMRYFQQDFS